MKYRMSRQWVSKYGYEQNDRRLFSDYINEWGSLELMYQLVNRAGKLVGAFTDRVMDEQKYRNCFSRNLQARSF